MNGLPMDKGAVGDRPPIRGLFLVLEGIDGSGKSTQVAALRDWLPGSGLMPPQARLLVTHEPGGTELGHALRRLLLDPPTGCVPSDTTELLLYAADRAQHVEELILPGLAAGHWVLSDRFSGSTAAYQGFGRGLSHGLIETLEGIATHGLRADLTLWLELPVAAALRRNSQRPADRIEAVGEAFLERVAAGFATLANQQGWERIDADRPQLEVWADLRERVRHRVGLLPLG